MADDGLTEDQRDVMALLLRLGRVQRGEDEPRPVLRFLRNEEGPQHDSQGEQT